MNTEVQYLEDDQTQNQLPAIEVEVVRDATLNAFCADYNCAPERALEISDETSIIEGEAGAEDDTESNAEIETAEEISLKNGVYHEIKRKLEERFGVPPHEIAFIHEADTLAKKAALFKAVNRGSVRILIGSTGKMGTGVNVQKRLVALHHLDEPWKPAELEQREGRILRQGNIYPEAYVFHYVTERSFDGYMLQTLESKARFISQILAGEVTARTAEDVGEMVLTVAQVKAIASGNPLVQRRIELEVKLVKLDRLRAAYYNNRAAMRADLEELPERIARQEAEVAGHERAILTRQPLEDDGFCILLKRKLGDSETIVLDKRERAGAHLRYLADLLIERLHGGGAAGGSTTRSFTEEVGIYRGFNISICVSGNSRFSQASTLFNFSSEIHLRAPDGSVYYSAAIGESNVGITQSVDYQLRHIEDRLEQTRSGLEMMRARLETVRAEIDKPWTHAAEYRRLKKLYEESGEKLQSEGIGVESNTTFTAEGCGDAETLPVDQMSEEGDGSATTDESALVVMEDFGAYQQHRNPFTGLEDWSIVVDEPQDTAPDTGEVILTDEHASHCSFSFNFEAEESTEVEPGYETDDDVFLSSPHNDVENPSDAALGVRSEGIGNAGGDACESDGSRPRNVCRYPPNQTTKTDKKRTQGAVGKKSALSAQPGFLWH